jgi:hypothetical protein
MPERSLSLEQLQSLHHCHYLSASSSNNGLSFLERERHAIQRQRRIQKSRKRVEQDTLSREGLMRGKAWTIAEERVLTGTQATH